MPAVGSRGDQRTHSHELVGVWPSPEQLKQWQGTSVSSAWEVMLLLGVPELRAASSTHPEPSSDLCHRQETHRSSCLHLEGATCFLVLKKATKHRDRPPVSRPRAPPWGYTHGRTPGGQGGPQKRRYLVPVCSAPSPPQPCTLAPGVSGRRGRDPSPPCLRSPEAPPPCQHGQRLTPWQGRRGSSTGAAGRSAAKHGRHWAASWPRLCGALP